MGNILTIANKELRIYLTTWTSYIIFGAFVLISAFFFQQLVLDYQLRSQEYTQYQYKDMLAQMNLTDWVVAPLLSNVVVFFLFMMPILTMRLFSEERKTKTLQLLMTTPVRPVEIVLGKYVAALCIMLIMLGLSFFFPVLLHIFGATSDGTTPLDWNTITIGYLGMALFGAASVAVGLLTSSLTESQIVAVISSFAILLMLYVIGAAARGQEGVWEQFFQYLSITTHLEGFLRGMIRLPDLVYYLSLSFFGIFLTYQVIEAERWK
ncbi:MAG: ABC transporter permease subunit [Myxococcota bacterium]|nr:ABC transporter permease subunit [Myxococcota bacterium]